MLIFFIGAEFLSMIIVVVYVGAVAVLFLFVCMMLNIKIEINNNIFQNVISTILFGALLVLLIGMLLFDIFANIGLLSYIDNIVWVDLFMRQIKRFGNRSFDLYFLYALVFYWLDLYC